MNSSALPDTGGSGGSPDVVVVIPAGGGGTRLWPRSRQSSPKQFLDLVTDRTMLQETVDRVASLASAAHTFVITNAKHVAPVRDQLPEVPAKNIIGEPEGRDSGPAIGLMAALLERRLGPDAVMIELPADHVILNTKHFVSVLRAAVTAAQEDYLVTVGIQPTGPDTGFGYIQSAETISQPVAGLPVLRVIEFKEKPKREVAEQYLEAGGYFWNAGMYIARVGALRELFRTHVPDMEDGFARCVDALESGDEAAFAEAFHGLRKISFDYAIAEKADKVAVVPADIGWSDVGSWARLAEVLSEGQPAEENVVVGQHVGVDTSGSLIYAPHRLVATIGVEDLVVIDTPDVTLICPKSRSEDVKKIVEALRERGQEHLL